jgi:Flp pilus assembly protein CpaB
VAVDTAQAAGGLIQPADVVDVIATVDGRTFYAAAGLDVVQVTREGSGLGVGDELIIVLAVDDRTALDLASAQAAGSIVVVRATGAAPPLRSAGSSDPTETP